MSETCLKNGYTGYASMGKPIPVPRRKAACELCKEYGIDEKTASNAVARIAKLLERNNPHEALLECRKYAPITIADSYKLIAVLMTDDDCDYKRQI